MPPVSNGPVPENQTAAFKAARMAVIILSALIVIAVVALIVGGVRAVSRKPSHASGASSFQLPPGARIVEMQTQPGRLILRVRDQKGEEVDVIDTQDGHLVSQIKSTPAPARP